MEKMISVEERIRRAEEIYNRRNSINGNERYTYKDYSKNKNQNKNYKIIKKMIIQIIICFMVYAIFYVISNSNYIFSEDFRNSVKAVLTKETDFNKIYNDLKRYFSEKLYTVNDQKVENLNENGEQSNNSNQESHTSNDQVNVEGTLDTQNNQENLNEENIGGSTEESISAIEEQPKSQNEEKSQMQIDADDIKSSIDFIVPVEGTISSTFGLRTPSTSTVPRNHTGLDIAAKTGTIIKSATDGEVILASSEGDYGKHYQIQIENVVIIYAHCSKLYLKEGDKVTRGESIAEVGSTGNSTGPHLHFEIRKDGRAVDPQLILDI